MKLNLFTGLMLSGCLVAGTVGAARGQSLSEKPGTIRTGMGTTIRTSTGVPMRATPTGMITSVRGLPGRPYNGGYTVTGTNLSVSGSGWHLNVNGGLARDLAFGSGGVCHIGSIGSRGTRCVTVRDAEEVLAGLPTHVRNSARVLHGSDYGWSYDVICIPGSGGSQYVYIPRGYAYGWGSSGTYYAGNQPQLIETAGWGTLNQPATSMPAQPPAPVDPPTAIELARIALTFGDGEAAALHYREHILENSEDSQALREYGLTMLELGKLSDGFAAIRKAYRDTPTLAATPIELARLGFDAPRMRKLMWAVSPEANKIQTSSAWLTLAALLQAQGKDVAAQRMLQKSEANGLDEPITQAMKSALQR